MSDAWEPMAHFVCPCGCPDFDHEPMWRYTGALRAPVTEPERSTCRGCGVVYEWGPEVSA